MGRVWCPIKGVECKELGENRFLVSFLQASGKRRALEDGPWMINKDLIIMVDFDGSKAVDYVVFDHIPIWVRVMKMPLGMMNREYGVAISNQIGSFMDMDKEEDGSVVGQFLRIKVKIDINKPLMMGVCLGVGEGAEEKEIWCPLVYEFLPDFCYICGRIGHIGKGCETKLKEGEERQYSRRLRFIPERKWPGGDVRSLEGREQKSSLPWRFSYAGSRAGAGSSNFYSSHLGNRGAIDALSWRKEDRSGEGKKVEE